MNYYFKNLFISICIFLTTAIAYADDNQIFPLNPRFIGDLSASEIGSADGDFLFPLYGNSSQIFYLDTQGGYGTNNSWLGSFGLGTRFVINNSLLGGYVFGDYDKDANSGQFYVINPGLEFMTGTWDSHVNAYFPTTNSDEISGLNFASQFGVNNFIHFQQHCELDALFSEQAIVGNGVDGEVGYSIPTVGNRTRIFLGGYYYKPPGVNQLAGVEGGVEVPLNRIMSLKISASHDNVQGNQACLTLRIALGSITQQADNNIDERILDPIIRHEGTLNTAAGIISQEKLLNSGREGVVYNNLWFFNPGTVSINNVTFSDCTYEHPCTGINSNIINSINNIQQNARLYLAPGNYINSNPGTGYSLNNGQSIFGLTDNYLQLAQGNQRALLNDTLLLNGNNIVSNLQIDGQTNLSGILQPDLMQTGIVILPAAIGNIQINNTLVSATTIDANHEAVALLNASPTAMVFVNNSALTATVNGYYSFARALENFGSIQVSNSSLSSFSTTINSGAQVLFNKYNGRMNIMNSFITATSPTYAVGLFNDDLGMVNFYNSNINVNSPTYAVGVFNEDFGETNVNYSTIISNSQDFSAGIFNEDFGLINIVNSSLFSDANTFASGVFNEDFGHVNIMNSSLYAKSSNDAFGLFNEDFGVVNIVNSTLAANANTQAAGIFNQDDGQVNVFNSSIIP